MTRSRHHLGSSAAAATAFTRVHVRPSKVVTMTSRTEQPSGHFPQQSLPLTAINSTEQEHHRTMQALLKEQRQATRERQAAAHAAAATAAAVARTSQTVTPPPPEQSLPALSLQAKLPAPLASPAYPPAPPAAVTTQPSAPTLLPQPPLQRPPPIMQEQDPPSGISRPEDRWGLPVVSRLPVTAAQSVPDPTVARSLSGGPFQAQWMPQQLAPQRHLGLTEQPPQQQLLQQQQPQRVPDSAPALPQPPLRQRQSREELQRRKPLPTLLPGASVPLAKRNLGADSRGIGLNILPPSARSGSAGDNGGGGSGGRSFVGSTRSAKSTFGSPTLPSRASWPGYGPLYGYGSNAPFAYGGTKDGWQVRPSSTAGDSAAAAAATPRAADRPPMVQGIPLDLNPSMKPSGSSALSLQQPPLGGGVPGAAGAVLAPLGSASPGSIGSTAVSAEGSAAAKSSSIVGTVATAAGSGPATAAEAPGAAAKKRPARPAALWLSSFVQATGRAAGTSTTQGTAAGATVAAAPAATSSAKQPVADAGAVAAAMARAAAERSAVELHDSVKDLPATIPQLQARLEAAVQAEQESEIRALRALYAAGSLRQLQREGVVLVGLTAAENGRLYRSTLWRFSVMQKKGSATVSVTAQPPPLPYHKLRPGASVIITRHTAASSDSGASGGSGTVSVGATTSVDAETGLPADGVEGVVLEAHKDHLVVALESRSHEAFQAMVSEVTGASDSGHGGRAAAAAAAAAAFLGWRLDQSVRDTTTRRHLEAIRRLGAWSEPSVEDRLGEARVRAVLTGSRSAALLAAEPPEWVREDRWREDARAALAAQQGLNDSQRRAVAAALTRTVTLWQGPPGTGKTRTLLALIEILVRVRNAGIRSTTQTPRGARRSFSSSTSSTGSSPRAAAMGPVLAVADTNTAVDNLVEGLAARGVKAVRLGPAAKARESLRHLSVEAQAEATPLGHKALELRTQALRKQELWRQAPRSGASGPDAAAAATAAIQAAEVRADLERAEAALREAAVAVVAVAEVVVATCTAAGDSMLDSRPWRCVVVDEASQATEPSVLVALTRGAAFVVMAGDPRQLPPTVVSEAALQHGLHVTLFERMAGAGGVLPLLLDTQYRMHPAISAFPSAFFYGGRLRDGVTAADKPTPKGFPWPNPSKPLALVQVTGGREETSRGIAEMIAATTSGSTGSSSIGSSSGVTGDALPRRKGAASKLEGREEGTAAAPRPRSNERASYRNPAEALLALAVTQRLLAQGDVTSAAILTPYRAQVRLIEALSSRRGLEAAWSAAGVEVAVFTVDGYQGREADIVVFSAVRANDRGAVGFLSDPRRMNVAITRPRRGLVVLADTDTLTRGSADWGVYVKWARAQGIVVSDADVIEVLSDVEEVLSDVEEVLSDSNADDSAVAAASTPASRAAGDGKATRFSGTITTTATTMPPANVDDAAGVSGGAIDPRLAPATIKKRSKAAADAKAQYFNAAVGKAAAVNGSMRGLGSAAAAAMPAAAEALESSDLRDKPREGSLLIPADYRAGERVLGQTERQQQQEQQGREMGLELQPKARRKRRTKTVA